MSALRPGWLLLITVTAAIGGFVATSVMAASGIRSPVLPISSVVTLAGVGLIVLGLGLVVHRDQRRGRAADEEAELRRRHPREPDENTGDYPERTSDTGRISRQRPKPRRLHPLQAVRVVAAAQACAYAGALIAGWHIGVLMDLAPAVGLGAPNATNALVMIIGGMMWVIIGFVVERLCKIPPDDGAARRPSTDEGKRLGQDYGDRLGPEPGAARTRDPQRDPREGKYAR
ncbi:MAG TPA: DUF3180 domain-containing protein [Candidatus Nesterenkonia stercoripullorum]|uniref:DUF3180 domain-containing protein n=1 Tax=Candidatus Nesterenkonia stercoripullorum TaxID=2838701 RepID=A0A9D1S0J5_9MICC|nr:DUF3180 domain-containing protein [Candidatus Nesterenkonia stercoripullorum]